MKGQNHPIPRPTGKVNRTFNPTENNKVTKAKRLKYAKVNMTANVLNSGMELLSEK